MKEDQMSLYHSIYTNNAGMFHSFSERCFIFFLIHLPRPHSHITIGFPQTFKQSSLTGNRVLRKQMSVMETKF